MNRESVRKRSYTIIALLSILSIVLLAGYLQLRIKYVGILDIAARCEVTAYRNGIDTNQPITRKHLNRIDKELLKDFEAQAQDLKDD